MKSAAQHSRTAGFSLLEVLAALVILSALSAALWPWFTQAQDARGASTQGRGAVSLVLATNDDVRPLEDVALVAAYLGTDVEVVTDEVARNGRWVWVRFTVGEDAVVRPFLAPAEDATR